MRNKYPGTCYRCGKRVEVGDGHFERVGNEHRKKWPNTGGEKWLTQHADCAIQFRNSDRHYLYAPDAVRAV